jgi:hypothetical protein
MAQGHSVDEYLETNYFLAFPIGEYRPISSGSPTLASRVAEMLGVSRASAWAIRPGVPAALLPKLSRSVHNSVTVSDTVTEVCAAASRLW